MTRAADRDVVELLQAVVARLDELVALQRQKHETGQRSQADQLLGPVDVAVSVGVDVRTLRRMRAGGEFPEPQIVGNRPKWRRSDVDRWMAEARA